MDNRSGSGDNRWTNTPNGRRSPRVADRLRNLVAMPADTPTAGTYLMRPGEVMDLLRITRTTLHEWRVAGRLEGVRAHERAHWKYPASQPILQEALSAVGGRR